MKITKNLQQKLEDIFKKLNYKVRYEKGSFKGGFCVIEEQKVVVINKFFPLESKVNTLVTVLSDIEIDKEKLSSGDMELIDRLKQKEIQF